MSAVASPDDGKKGKNSGFFTYAFTWGALSEIPEINEGVSPIVPPGDEEQSPFDLLKNLKNNADQRNVIEEEPNTYPSGDSSTDHFAEALDRVVMKHSRAGKFKPPVLGNFEDRNPSLDQDQYALILEAEMAEDFRVGRFESRNIHIEFWREWTAKIAELDSFSLRRELHSKLSKLIQQAACPDALNPPPSTSSGNKN